MVKIILFLLLGLFTGTLSGIVGIGGGVIIIPALVFLFGFSQQQAQGTTLALLVPPIGFLAAYTYFKSGFVNLQVAALICIGFFVGGFVGSKIAVNLPNVILQKIFGAVVIIIGLYMLLKK
ncbi:permease [candidate division WOR-3 bacterium RBG_13_43_14]|uniref:Probable membrane transporter protein n=1 Tax=candidate division WOR-3 bacterium RBG_13_43_14 TaxID=1802590 RepID=A0A1F4UAZ4_UNCW3|nr:MAG: permease [candidate division WOR-3 bacterium RBG_13_43_14]